MRKIGILFSPDKLRMIGLINSIIDELRLSQYHNKGPSHLTRALEVFLKLFEGCNYVKHYRNSETSCDEQQRLISGSGIFLAEW